MPDKKTAVNIEQQLHELKSPLTLLSVFFSALEEKKTPDEVFHHVKCYSKPCRKAISEIEMFAKNISKKNGTTL